MSSIPLQTLRLDTQRLTLRQWQETDFPLFAKMSADPRVMRYFPQTLSRYESDRLASRIMTLINQQGWGFWAAELKETQAFIGFIGLHRQTQSLPQSPFIEIGWRLDPTYWRQGLATEGAQSALDFAFTTLKESDVYAFTSYLNRPSLHVMKKLGMHNSLHDFDHPSVPDNHPLQKHALYKITKATWLTTKKLATSKHTLL